MKHLAILRSKLSDSRKALNAAFKQFADDPNQQNNDLLADAIDDYGNAFGDVLRVKNAIESCASAVTDDDVAAYQQKLAQRKAKKA